MKNGNHHYNTVEAAIHYITAQQPNQPTLDEISEHVHLSKFHLQRIFKEWAGVTPKEFLQYLTIEQSKKLLREGKSTLETSFDVGLSGNGRLHDLFLKYEACTPGEFKNEGQGMIIRWEVIATPFGDALIGENDKGLCKVAFVTEQDAALAELKQEYPKAELIRQLGKNGHLLKQYFADWKVPEEKIDLYFRGTPFQVQVWRALIRIPSGQLRTYQDISATIGNAGAVRAVGTAIGRNPIAYLIPCHRVIRSDGLTGGYRWEPERKMIINAFEQVQVQN
jgi:AraC family transcriptional regulator of adaptative response/methylated-DNA-[protein]-cysteine methyltransferase